MLANRTTYAPHVEQLEDRCTPSCIGDGCPGPGPVIEAPLGNSPIVLTVTATTMTQTLPNGACRALTPIPLPRMTLPGPMPRLQEAVLVFLADNGLTPPTGQIPGPPGQFVAAGFVTPSLNLPGPLPIPGGGG